MTEPYYHRFAVASESRWNTERDVPWDQIDMQGAWAAPEDLALLRDATLIESYHPMSTRQLAGLFWDDVDATAVLTIEMFEGFRHFWILRRYLEQVGFEPRISDEELIEIRRRNLDNVRYEPDKRLEVLLNFAWSEHFAAYFFKRLAERARDPFLKVLLEHIMADELRHAAGALRILSRYAEQSAEARREILSAARRFRHYGQDVGALPIAQADDAEAMGRIVHRTLRACRATWRDWHDAGRELAAATDGRPS
jgi:rubrerythrin